MNPTLQSILAHPLTAQTGWTLLHFAWQGLLIFLACRTALAFAGDSPTRRYFLCCTGLLAMAVCPLATFMSLEQPHHIQRGLSENTATIRSEPVDIELTPSMAEPPAAASSAEPTSAGDRIARTRLPAQKQTGRGADVLAWAVLTWAAGVLLLALRLVFGLCRISQWRRRAVALSSSSQQTLFENLCERMQIRRGVRVLETMHARVPAVIGWMRPVIVVPSSMLTGLSPQELESILAHELAHIRRHDYIVNLVQNVLETVLFYHPAVWWLSQRARVERENCCDDVAIASCGNRVVFARALARMEEIRCRDLQLVAASGASLSDRIRRILRTDAPAPQTRWPAGVLVLLSLGLFAVIVATRQATAEPIKPGRDEPQTATSFSPTDQDTFASRKSEVQRKDPRTGIDKQVFADIRLTARPQVKRGRATGLAAPRRASVDMMYSNVLRYSFIPQRIVKQLNAPVLGEIDFGEKPPQTARPFQSAYIAENEAAENSPPQPKAQPRYVSTVHQPTQDQPILPYRDDTIWAPGHLASYGMNRTNQTVFAVVRLTHVDLGVGPAFGPINALVLNDENSAFGVIGRDWAQQPRGPDGESLWFTADGTFHFTSGVNTPKPRDKQPQEGAARVTVSSSRSDYPPARLARNGVRVLQSHTYNLSRRASTDTIDIGGTRVPIDEGVTHAGTSVYATLFYDVVAVDAESRKVLWQLPWGKTTPTWHTISVVELTTPEGPQLAVELFAAQPRTRELVYKYLDFASGKEIQFTPPREAESNQRPQVRIATRDKERITRAVVSAQPTGRSAVEILRQRGSSILRAGGPVGSVTMFETIVSAKPRYLLGEAMDANEVLLSLPEGSGLRAEFSGERVDIRKDASGTTVTTTDGRLELLDAGGIVRATASADGGAEQLVIRCRIINDEVVLRVRSQRVKQGPDFPNPPVQIRMNPNTGARDEKDQPHGSVRYAIEAPKPDSDEPARMRMIWRYEYERLAREATEQTGKSWEEILLPQPDPPASRQPQAAWGPNAREGRLRLRLSLATQEPTVGKPLRLKLELKNFGSEPATYDPQHYTPFRVLRVLNEAGQSDLFVGLRPQTSGGPAAIAAGETKVLWQDVDVSPLFLFDKGRYDISVVAPRYDKHLPGSNEIRVELAAGQQRPRKRILQRLTKLAPEKWNVSNGFGAIYVSHQPTKLKRDATTIQIWFTEKPLPDDFQVGRGSERQEIERLGLTSLGHMNVAAPARAKRIWPEYIDRMRQVREDIFGRAADLQNPSEKEAARRPWSAFGKVTDANGNPLQGVSITAHCGMGSLRQTGSTKSDASGNYELRFGPGFWSENKSLVQAATISPNLAGHFEKNLHRQGDLIAAFEKNAEVAWGDKTADDLFLPGQPREINFVMIPSVTIRGVIEDDQGNRPEGLRVSLKGPELPPSCSVAANTTTNARGEYELRDVPTGFQFQILVEPKKAEPPWLAWATPLVTFARGSGASIQLIPSAGLDPLPASAVNVRLRGPGVNWKTALRSAAADMLAVRADNKGTLWLTTVAP